MSIRQKVYICTNLTLKEKAKTLTKCSLLVKVLLAFESNGITHAMMLLSIGKDLKFVNVLSNDVIFSPVFCGNSVKKSVFLQSM